MKLKNTINSILGSIVYIAGFLGMLTALGAIGSLECESITFAQFFFMEFIAVLSMLFAFGAHIIRVRFNYYTKVIK